MFQPLHQTSRTYPVRSPKLAGRERRERCRWSGGNVAPDLEAWPSSADSPLRGWSTRDSSLHAFGRGTSLPMNSFDSPWGRTLETFSGRSEESNPITRSGRANPFACVDFDDKPIAILAGGPFRSTFFGVRQLIAAFGGGDFPPQPRTGRLYHAAGKAAMNRRTPRGA